MTEAAFWRQAEAAMQAAPEAAAQSAQELAHRIPLDDRVLLILLTLAAKGQSQFWASLRSF